MSKRRALELALVALVAAAYGCEDGSEPSSAEAESEHAAGEHDKAAGGKSAAGRAGSETAAGSGGAKAVAGSGGAKAVAGSGGAKPVADGGATAAADGDDAGASDAQGSLKLTSTAVRDGEKLPAAHRCESSVGSPTGPNPPLSWSGAPPATKSFALLLRDRTFMNYQHWTLFDIPASVTSLPEGVPAGATTEPDGAKQADNSRGLLGPGYYGPCGQSGTNNYEFVLYALDVESLPEPGTTGASVESALADHVLGQASLKIVSGPE